MSAIRFVMKEIMLRKFSFLLGVVAVFLAVAVLSGQLTLLKAFDYRTEKVLDDKRRETEKEMMKIDAEMKRLEEEMHRMEDDYRKIMKQLGFNLVILPADQELGALYDSGYASKDMPEDYVKKLANSGIMTVRHLLPSLEQKIRWEEQGNRTVILIGTRGEVPLAHRDPKKPLQDAVKPGTVVLGRELWDSLGLKIGDTITVLGEEFEVAQCHPERGTKDDVTMWIDLDEAQKLLDKEDRINAILALKCVCANNELETIRQEIKKSLPEVKVIELSSRVKTREEARDRARVAVEMARERSQETKAAALAALGAEKKHRQNMREELEGFAAWLIPLVLIGAIFSVGLLMLYNVRSRTTELGVLRAIGFQSNTLFSMLLSRAALIGLLGAMVGYWIGVLAGVRLGIEEEGAASVALFASPLQWLMLTGATILLTMVAGLPPAIYALNEDPADILQKDF